MGEIRRGTNLVIATSIRFLVPTEDGKTVRYEFRQMERGSVVSDENGRLTFVGESGSRYELATAEVRRQPGGTKQDYRNVENLLG